MLLISNVVGPVATGFVAVFPVSTSSTILILHPRLGGQATAAVAANGLFGFAGIAAGLTAMHFAIPTLGLTIALALLLVVAMAWNMTVWIVRVRALSFERGVGFTWRMPRSAIPTQPQSGRSA
ncbi:MAG: hypothetical protein IT199_06510 [Solirubrobacterales bacterium]|nr:hypothetical protein [Solirubrobacterales bacterium]